MVAGNVADIAYAKQSAQGTPASTPKIRALLTGGTAEPVRNVIDIEETGGGRLRSRSVISSASVGGTPEMAARVDDFIYLLYLALGSVVITGVSGNRIWTITRAGTLPYATFWRMLGQLIFEKFQDCKVAQLVITSEAGQPVKVQATVAGLRAMYQSDETWDTVALTDENPMMHYDGAGAFVVEGSPVSCIERIVITINNNAAVQYGDSIEGCAVTEGMLDITLEITQTITDPDLYNRYHYGSATPTIGDGPTSDVLTLSGGIDFKWTRVDSSPGPERSIEVVAPRLQLQSLAGYEPNTGGDPLKDTQTYKIYDPGGVTEPITVTGHGSNAIAAA